ncbi:protein asteroid homolog 1 [Echeneis naucrates]|uniref:protein asteroid homolog 1 n=1 Tax=Echeneis naucrates TaxID=173247 RepID=UPI00111460E4|nr:protein asteroid homolog 1-like [Echeneis naucrates]XP_029369275.1 protein asteroid homolog 1-like [Echeneis naucrates]XP_029369276.1 protein asteroid homolog 1-like [Echeneis naucrates]
MGVHGLTTYVEGNTHFLRDVKFRESRLVIDGCSLYFRLYFNHGLDQQHGGDYDAFARLLIKFLSVLAACSIQPYVVLDGGMDPSDKKFSTLRQRLQSKIKEADSISHGRNGAVLPIFTRDVFIQILTQRGVPLYQCSAEADWEIACLAHKWNCPVLSNDSDFYIFDLPGGYLPFNFFQWANLNGKAPHRYISARCYTTKGLCHWFGGMNPELLPLCAVLTGNDYGTPKDVETLLALADVSALGRGGGRGKGRAPSSRIESILIWLSSFTSSAKALEEVSRLMGEDACRDKTRQKGRLTSQLWAGMQEYHLTPQSSLIHWFSGGNAAPAGWTAGLPQLPQYLSFAAAKGLLAPSVVDALVMHRVLLTPQVENSKLPSSHCSARTIRQAIYGMLLQKDQYNVPQGMAGSVPLFKGQGGGAQAQNMRGQENFRDGRGRGGRARGGGHRGRGIILPTQQGVNVGFSVAQTAVGATSQIQGSSVSIFVEEYDRLDLNLKKTQVEAHPPRTLLLLDTLDQTTVAARLGVLLEVLGVRELDLAAVPLHLRLAVAVTGFWLREASPTPSQHQVQALVLGIVHGELSRNNQPGATRYQYAVPQLNWAAECNVLAGLERQRGRPGERRGLDVGAAHSFSQWQACLWSAFCLNQLLLQPLIEPRLSWLYSGTLVHGLLKYLKEGRVAESLLTGGPLSGQLYFSLLDAVRSCSSTAHPTCSASGRGRRGRGRGGRKKGRGRGRGTQGGGHGTEEINNRFALLMSDGDW